MKSELDLALDQYEADHAEDRRHLMAYLESVGADAATVDEVLARHNLPFSIFIRSAREIARAQRSKPETNSSEEMKP